MAAYIILDIEVTNPEGYKDYAKLASETVKLYGGKYIVRGGVNETLEGDWQAKKCPNAHEYAPAWALRHPYAKSKAAMVEGV